MDVDTILEMRGIETKSSPDELAKDIVLKALFKGLIESPSKHLAFTKRHLYSHITRNGDEAHAKMRM